MFVCHRPRLAVGATLCALLLSAPLSAATPRDELLRFVPNDIGFCCIVQNLRDNISALEKSPFIQQFQQSAAGKALETAPQLQKLRETEETLRKQLGIGWNELRDDILGDAVVFAYRPGARGNEQGLMLIRARDAKALGNLVKRFNEAQQAKDLLKLTELKHKDLVYYRRVEKRTDKGKDIEETSFYHVRGPVLVFSGQQKLLLEALDQEAAARENSPLSTWLQELGAERALFTAYVNPRAFDADLDARIKAVGDGGLSAILKTVAAYWKAMDGLALSLTLDQSATVSLGVRGRSDALPLGAKRLFAEMSQPTNLWRQCPDDAIFAVGGRLDVAAFSEVFAGFLPPETRKAIAEQIAPWLKMLGKTDSKDLVNDVLSAIGPDWIFWMTSPADAKQMTPEFLFALRIGTDDKTAPADDRILDQLDFFLKVAALGGKKPVTVKSGTFDKDKVKYLECEALPPGVRPAFAVKHGFLVAAGAPELVSRFTAPPPGNGDGPAPLLRVSFSAWRTYLKARRNSVEEMLAQKDGMTPAQAREQYDSMVAALEFLDRLEIRQQAGKGFAVLSLELRTAKPLK